MKVAVVGTGYVGLVQGACLSELGNTVWCVDKDPKKIETLKNGGIPIYEPGLEEVVKRNSEAGRLHFTTDLAEGMEEADIVFIAVGTPPREDGSADLKYVDAVAKEIAENIKRYTVIVNKSTVPVGTGDRVTAIIKETYNGEFDVVSNPEFLREGSALADFMRPDRVVLGVDLRSKKAKELMEQIYRPLDAPIFITDIRSAELIKYASNSFLAVQISYINGLSEFAEKMGANIKDVAKGMKLDKRIGSKAFLNAGLGYGGSCFPKDVKALLHMVNEQGLSHEVLEKTEEINATQRTRAVERITKRLGKLKDQTIAVWGVAFKPNTDDIREAPALDIIESLVKAGAQVKVFDPVAELPESLASKVQVSDSAFEAAIEADALIVVTEWNEFREADLCELKGVMKGDYIFDGRNIFERDEVEDCGFIYDGMGT